MPPCKVPFTCKIKQCIWMTVTGKIYNFVWISLCWIGPHAKGRDKHFLRVFHVWKHLHAKRKIFFDHLRKNSFVQWLKKEFLRVVFMNSTWKKKKKDNDRSSILWKMDIKCESVAQKKSYQRFLLKISTVKKFYCAKVLLKNLWWKEVQT